MTGRADTSVTKNTVQAACKAYARYFLRRGIQGGSKAAPCMISVTPSLNAVRPQAPAGAQPPQSGGSWRVGPCAKLLSCSVSSPSARKNPGALRAPGWCYLIGVIASSFPVRYFWVLVPFIGHHPSIYEVPLLWGRGPGLMRGLMPFSPVHWSTFLSFRWELNHSGVTDLSWGLPSFDLVSSIWKRWGGFVGRSGLFVAAGVLHLIFYPAFCRYRL